LVVVWLLFPNLLRLHIKAALQPRWYAAMGVGIAIIIFIMVQRVFIPTRMFLQHVYLLTGLLICTICLLPPVRKYYAHAKESFS
jgi:hypothetical protein